MQCQLECQLVIGISTYHVVEHFYRLKTCELQEDKVAFFCKIILFWRYDAILLVITCSIITI